MYDLSARRALVTGGASGPVDILVNNSGPAAWTMTGAVVSVDAGWLAH